ncbi:MAG: beta-N-acetylglucosaminidase domain-containing protein [Clostridia bacterium]|nr:beta-N-acetylglucosaminidase domain-containing protein [Clostridia bacterium]
MIYPSFAKSEISEFIRFDCSEINVSGYEAEYAESLLDNIKSKNCKGDKLYITIHKESTRRTTYIEKANRYSDEKYFMEISADSDMSIQLTVSGKKSLYRAVQRIKHMLADGEFPIGTVEDYPLFEVRGYIEGFYGTPWEHGKRLEMLQLMSSYGMNTYYYAPKDDPYHRSRWSELYPENEIGNLMELVGFCNANFIDFAYCIAPGQSMKYSNEEDFEKLCCKVKQLYDIGVRTFGLLVDDIPENLYYEEDKAAFDGEAVNAHIVLSNSLNAFLASLSPDCCLTVCPLQYHGKGNEYYISKLGRGIDGDISLFWTGRNICSQEITVSEAVIFADSTNRKPLYWDNFPVNDAEMYNEMHLGYISGRDPELYRYSKGIISNTMQYAMSSKIPLLTVCDYLWNPVAYEGFESWKKAIEIVFGAEAQLIMPFADNLLTSCLKVENSPMLNAALAKAEQSFFAGDIGGAMGAVVGYMSALDECCEYLRTVDNPVVSELKPWVEKQFIALDLIKAAASLLLDNSDESRAAVAALLERYLNHPKVLCDFSLQAFAERMLSL